MPRAKFKIGTKVWLEIPRNLHPIVRDVVESLALRDVDCAQRYLETYAQK